ncbi:MAG: FAD-dependent oxidoreductase [Alphaproteobacteria bacterium]|nr:FAD-dependent oxidoreductase [Alphaproteobacteria bacterium]
MRALRLLTAVALAASCSGDSVKDADPIDDSAHLVDDTATPPALSVDVLVIGAGPAGLAAAWEAQEAGASVVVLEMDERSGGGGWYARQMFAAGTGAQAEAGIVDSPAQALAEWASFTDGGDPTDPWVIAMVEGSAGILDWLVDSFGAEVGPLVFDVGAGSVPRVHPVTIDGEAPVAGLVTATEAAVWTEHRADALVSEDGRVVGAQFTDLRTGEEGWIEAGATVVATGGFARDLDRVLADRPGLDGATVVFEHHPNAVGGGHPLLEALGVPFQNAGSFGVYVHAVEDWREPGEALWPRNLFATMIVDLEGQRVADEQAVQGFKLVESLLEAPEKRLLALYPAALFEPMRLAVPAYNWAEAGQEEEIDALELIDEGLAWRFADAADAAAHFGVDPDALTASVQRYDDLARQGTDDDFGKPGFLMVPFGADPIYVIELVAGAAKAFGGAALDEQARVLGVDGTPVPGLYAAGEVAGMLGTEAVGQGFSGSLTAVFLTGRVAGREAAAAR